MFNELTFGGRGANQQGHVVGQIASGMSKFRQEPPIVEMGTYASVQLETTASGYEVFPLLRVSGT
jgi:hypothetical protein